MPDSAAETAPVPPRWRDHWKIIAAAVVVALVMYAVAYKGLVYAPRTRRNGPVAYRWETLVGIYSMAAVLLPWCISLLAIRANRGRLIFLIALAAATVAIQVCGGHYLLYRVYHVRP